MPMKKESLDTLFNEFQKYNHIDPALNERYGVKRGLRNADGTGVLAGLTQICNVHGYILNEGEKCPVEGELTYRGVNVRDMVESCVAENRFGYEEVSYLLLFGHLPNQKQLDFYRQVLSQVRALPQSFVQDMILKAPSRDIMNKIGRSILALYSYDEFSQDEGLEAELKKAIYIIARMPTIMVNSYMAKIGTYDNQSTYFHPVRPGETVAQSILSTLRITREYTEEGTAQIVIFGKRGHAEVLGLVGQTAGEAIVVEKVEDVEKLDFSRDIYLYSQTTKSLDGFHRVINYIQQHIEEGATFRSFDTICRQVANRMPNIASFASRHDLVLFVSGRKSSNGKVLFNECRSVNARSYQIESADEIDMSWFTEDVRTVGICGATSTPKWLMEQCKERIVQYK